MSENTIHTLSFDAGSSGAGPWTRPAVLQWMASMPQSRRRLLNRAAETASAVLADERSREPLVCMAFFELCDDKALTEPEKALDYASTAVKLARATDDPHLIHYALGVLSHAHIACEQWAESLRVLRGYRHQAMGCCRFCRSDWLRRMGDWRVENRDGELALALVEDARRELGDQLDADTRGRLRFVRGIAYHFLGQRDLAIADAGAALGELSLASPRGYFLDTIALLACFLAGASQAEDATALEHLLRFKRRLKSVEGFSDVRCRLAWVGGQLHARLGDLRRGRDRLESTLAALANDGPPRHAVAVTADLAQLHARRAHESNLRPARRLIERCRTLEGLDADLRRGLEEVETVLRRRPENAFEAIALLRQSFIVPVPGLLAQRLPETWHPPENLAWRDSAPGAALR